MGHCRAITAPLRAPVRALGRIGPRNRREAPMSARPAHRLPVNDGGQVAGNDVLALLAVALPKQVGRVGQALGGLPHGLTT